MERKQQLWGFIAAVVLAAACLFPLGGGAEQPKAKPAVKPAPAQNDPAVAVVNGSKLYESDLKWQMENIKRGTPGSDQSSEANHQMRKMALQELIGFELLYQDGLSLGIKDVDKQVDDMIASGIKQFGSQEKLTEQLAKDGLTLDHVRKFLKKNVVIQAEVEKRIAPQVTVTEADIEAYYEANKDRLKHDGLVGARHILIKFSENATEEQKKAALEKIASSARGNRRGKGFCRGGQGQFGLPEQGEGRRPGIFSQRHNGARATREGRLLSQ